MKKHTFTFLFFCFTTVNAISVFNSNLWSQTAQDSTLFYYNSILDVKDVKLTSKAFEFFNKNYETALSKHDTIKAVYYLEMISFGQFKMGFTHESELIAVNALRLLENVKDREGVVDTRRRLYNQLGMTYRRIEDYDNALKFYNKALALKDKIDDKIAIVSNIANIYADSEDFKKAVEISIPYYDEALQIETKSIKTIFIDNLGYFQAKIGNPDALKNMEIALKIREEIQDLTGLFSSYRHLTLYYLDIKDSVKSKAYSKKLMEISDKLNAPKFTLEALRLQLRFQDNPDFERYITLANEIERKKQLQENNFAAIKYNYDEKEKEAQKLALQFKDSQIKAEQEKLNKIIYQGVALFGLLLTVFLYFIIKAKHRKDKLQQVYNTETRISKKVHDEVANDIYYVMTKMQNNNLDKDDVLDDLEDVYNKTRDISNENSIIDLQGTFEDHLKDLLLRYKNDDVNILTKDLNKIDWDIIGNDKKIVLHRVLQELMTNMRKHSKASLVVLTFVQTGKKIEIDYKDNGIGTNLIKSNGLLNTENRMESISGTIIFESKANEGFKARLTL